MAVACDTCSDRPIGCWKAVEYHCTPCYWNAKKAAIAKRACPLHKLDTCPFTPDRVVVINLKHRTDLRERGESQLPEKWHPQWPRPVWFDAINGWGNPACTYHKRMKGAWGCKMSHLAVLKQALDDNVQGLFVLEGDFLLDDEFPVLADEFFTHVPDDWELAYLGGQHRKSAPKVAPGVVKVRSLVRTHAYIARPSAQRKLYDFWSNGMRGHIDNALADHLGKEYAAYAPYRFIVGQGGAKSDIICRRVKLHFWRPDPIVSFRNASALRDRRQAVVSHKPLRTAWTNRLTGTQPIVFHAPGKGWDRGQRNELWKDLAAAALKLSIPPAKDIVVITWNNGEAGILEQQLDKNAQPHLVLGRGIHPWKNGMKNPLTLDALKTIQQPYVVGLDAFDVFYTQMLDASLQLLASGKKLVQNGDMGFWPRHTPRQYYTFEKGMGGDSRWPFINSGVWIAETKYALWYFAECAKLQDESYSDQIPWHQMFFQYSDDIGLDYKCKVFQTDINTRVLI